MATNKERAQRAREVLDEYSDRSGSLHGEEPIGYKMSDLITDLMHLHDEDADGGDDDWDTIIQRAEMDYDAESLEVDEEEGERTVVERVEQKPIETYSHEDWLAKAKGLFGGSVEDWVFKCPACANEASLQDWVDAGETREGAERRANVECIGRLTKGRSAFGDKGAGPCNYAAFGLLDLTPVRVVLQSGVGGEEKTISSFGFGEPRTKPGE